MTTPWTLARLGGGVLVLGVLGWRVGADPFTDGLRSVSPVGLAIAVVVTGVTTACAAWRWSLVANGIGVSVRLRTAFAAYYRSQFLNVTLPGGVLGDVHRAVDHGRSEGQVGRSVRAVAWERTAGQVVQTVLSVAVLAFVASPLRDVLPAIVGWALLAVAVVGIALVVARRRDGRLGRVVRAAGADLRHGLLAPRVWPMVVVASAIAAAGHVALFVVAANTVDSTASVGRILPLAVIVVLASAVPLNVAGWGPREGVAAWAFGSAGLSAGEGVTVSVIYGVMVLVATLPGAVVLIVGTSRRRHSPRDAEPLPVRSGREEVVHV